MTNTKNKLVARRYAEALVEIAKDGKLTYTQITNGLETIKGILFQSKDLEEFLTNPLVSIEDKKEVTDKVFKEDINVLLINFLKILIDKNRFDAFFEILDSYHDILDDLNNIKTVSVTSAVEMTEAIKMKLKNKLEEKLRANVIIETDVNPGIIAGLVIRIGDNIIDTSLKHKLEDLSKNITR